MKVTKTQLREMITHAIRRALHEVMDEPPSPDADVASNPSSEEDKAKDVPAIGPMFEDELGETHETMSYGQVPTLDKLEAAMGQEPYDMNLQGQDSIAFDYATTLGGVSGDTRTPESMHSTLTALLSAPRPEELDPDQQEQLQDVLMRWDLRYGDQDIAEHAASVATSILDTLGFESI